ncbi:hypothetical protein A2G07_15900 (plasmid) [Deinococcus radiodurans R1 = ATCC 13939 = DSM 20539]|nr:hypothetical protein A2G07_15900 [Deinococcus radiodurans R1 = ATCC 13939 = DSM 20539]
MLFGVGRILVEEPDKRRGKPWPVTERLTYAFECELQSITPFWRLFPLVFQVTLADGVCCKDLERLFLRDSDAVENNVPDQRNHVNFFRSIVGFPALVFVAEFLL